MFDFWPYLLLLWKKRWFLLANLTLVGIVSVVFAFFIAEKEYRSQATFLPPSGGAASSSGLGAMMAMGGNPFFGLLAGNESGDHIEAIFDSKVLKRNIIEEFNLYDNYDLRDSPNMFELAVKQMEKQIILVPTLRGRGIGTSRTISYTIQSYHTDPDTARMMAEFVFASLDSAIVYISINKARRNREFIESQFGISSKRLDSLQEAFRDFQITHKAFNITEQMKLTLKTYSDIKTAAIMNDIRLQALQREFRTGSPEINSALNLKRIYERQLAELEQSEQYAVIPSLNLSTELTPAYTNLFRSIEVQNQVHLMLTSELEQARLQEARDVSSLVLIDPPYTAEYKARPKRLSMVLMITAGYMFILTFIIVIYKFFTEFFRAGFRPPKLEN